MSQGEEAREAGGSRDSSFSRTASSSSGSSSPRNSSFSSGSSSSSSSRISSSSSSSRNSSSSSSSRNSSFSSGSSSSSSSRISSSSSFSRTSRTARTARAARTASTPWPMVRLGDVCEIRAGATHHGIAAENGPYPVYGSGGYICRATQWRCPANTVTIGRKGTLDKPLLIEEPFWNIDTCFGVTPNERLDARYLWRFCQGFDFYQLIPASGRPSTNSDAIKEITIPLPPLSVQREIVARLEKELGEADRVAAKFKEIAEYADAEFKAELDETFRAMDGDGVAVSSGAGGTRDSSFSSCSRISRTSRAARTASTPWPMVTLGDVCDEIRERIHSSKIEAAQYVTTDNMVKGGGGIREAEAAPSDVALVHYKVGDVLLSNIRPYLKKAWLADRDGGCSSDVIVFRSNRKDLSSEYLFRVLSQDGFFDYSMQNVSGTKMPRGKRDWIKRFEFPLPPLSVQRAIVSRLDAAQARCEKLKAAAERGLRAAEDLRKAILAEAFEP